MNAALFEILFGAKRQRMTETFTTNTTWTAPFTTSSIETLTGKGADGSREPDDEQPFYTITTSTIYNRRDGGTDVSNSTDETIHYGPAPANYCDAPVSTPSDPTYLGYRVCYTFNAGSETIPGAVITGANTTGFGKTFPGGVGTNATPATYNNQPITPGASYSLVIPGSGSITITYFK